jgi:hypothetical protein
VKIYFQSPFVFTVLHRDNFRFALKKERGQSKEKQVQQTPHSTSNDFPELMRIKNHKPILQVYSHNITAWANTKVKRKRDPEDVWGSGGEWSASQSSHFTSGKRTPSMVPIDIRLVGLCGSKRSLTLPEIKPLTSTLSPEFSKATNLFIF